MYHDGLLNLPSFKKKEQDIKNYKKEIINANFVCNLCVSVFASLFTGPS